MSAIRYFTLRRFSIVSTGTILSRLMPTITLNDGVVIPRFGVLAFRHDSPSETMNYVTELLAAGVRHLEICDLYGNTHTIADGIRKSNIPREDIFITLKIWAKNMNATEFIDSFHETIKSAGFSYIDMIMINEPIDHDSYLDLYRSMEILQEQGFVKTIGVSKVSIILLLDIFRKCKVVPSVIQLEISPFKACREIIEYCDDNNITIVCTELFSKGLRTKNPVIVDLSNSLDISQDDLLMRWLYTKKYALLLALYKCKRMSHLFSDSLQKESLTPNVMEQLDALDEKLETQWIPSSIIYQEE